MPHAWKSLIFDRMLVASKDRGPGLPKSKQVCRWQCITRGFPKLLLRVRMAVDLPILRPSFITFDRVR